MNRGPGFSASPAPFIHAATTSSGIAFGVFACLLPAMAWGAYAYGAAALLTVGTAVAAALAGEALLGLVRGRFSLDDGSALLTGALVGLAMPAGVPPHVPAAASLFAILLVKGAFGGLGSNWMNPALAGLVFAFVNWPAETAAWTLPRKLAGVAGVSGATPLGFVRSSLESGSGGEGPLALLQAGGYKVSELDRSVTGFLNSSVFSRLGAELPSGYLDLLVGNRPGAIGELSGLILLAASVILIAKRWIRWQIPASIAASYALLALAFGGLPFGEGFFSGDALFGLLSGSFILVAFFMASDPVSSPSRPFPMIVYGAGIGALTFLIRSAGARPEGTAFAVLLMNCVVPLLERPRRAKGAGA